MTKKIVHAIKTTLIALGATLLLLLLTIAGLFYFQASRPLSEDSKAVVVEIKPGMTIKKVSTLLGSRQLIRSPSSFELLAYLKEKQRKIQIGEYRLSPSNLPADILKQITSGKNTLLHPVTVPEGYRITEIAGLLARRGLVDEETFVQGTQSDRFKAHMGVDLLEGYLFPDTYHFSKYVTSDAIILTMLNNFKRRVDIIEIRRRGKALNLNVDEILALASIIEKETGLDSERKTIASVFHNRLKKNMRLQTDPTVIYAIKNFDGNLRKKDLSIDSPYNTYKYKGLPPGPIANPGLQSIQAALYPADTDYLYFVSRQDGSHQFSKTLREHKQAVGKYQLKTAQRIP